MIIYMCLLNLPLDLSTNVTVVALFGRAFQMMGKSESAFRYSLSDVQSSEGCLEECGDEFLVLCSFWGGLSH